MKKRYNITIILSVMILSLLVVVGCNTLGGVLSGDGVSFDDIVGDTKSIAKFKKEYKALLREDFTEEEKYYIGRSTSAFVFGNYELVKNKALTKYINEVGQTIALASDKSTTYNGYRFNVFKDSKPNAYATSGGMILISTGILSIMENEDELASVIAHEVQHVVSDHPTKAVKSETKKKAMSDIAKNAASDTLSDSSSKSKIFKGMMDSFGGVLGDVVDALDNGYEKETEFEADRGAVLTLQRAGYNVNALISLIGKLPSDKGKSNYGAIHPSPEQRIKAVKKIIKKSKIKPHNTISTRTKRFINEMKKAGIK